MQHDLHRQPGNELGELLCQPHQQLSDEREHEVTDRPAVASHENTPEDMQRGATEGVGGRWLPAGEWLPLESANVRVEGFTRDGSPVDVLLKPSHGLRGAEARTELRIENRTGIDQPLNPLDLNVDLVDESAKAAHEVNTPW
ncbi:hypothetical protein ACIA47_32420 [Micromonospora sp. NPDC051227]|uniref:hypothetical protein n=1 Tax=Micromonospora sp. NPDC051227 TaxID=3364285 RepID=UPI0037B063FD